MSEETYEGRLELTWTNKPLRLLADEDGSYEWVPAADYRVAEVRLLDTAATIGETRSMRSRAQDNLLIRGDALNALRSLTELPEFARELVGKVKVAYLDPPFNTQQSFLHYDDALEHSVWLTMMRDRLIQVKSLLSPEGSIWVHCDDTEGAHLKVLLDEIFTRECFITTFIWQKVDSPNDNKVNVTPDHDFIHCYAMRAENADGARLFARKSDPTLAAAYGQLGEDGRRFRDRLLKKNGKNSLREDRPRSYFPITDPHGHDVLPIHDDGREACWALGVSGYEALLASNADTRHENKLIWKLRPGRFVANPEHDPSNPKDGTPPWVLLAAGQHWVAYAREWASANPTRPWPSIWTDVKTTRQAKAHLRALFPRTTAFATPKPEQLLQRIIEVASVPGDIVLDCFLGSGTTAAAAHKMGRRWVGIERSAANLDRYAVPRLTKVAEGQDPGGITEAVGWECGAGFRVLDVAPSMFANDLGVVVLAEWATNGKLAEVTAAQLGFSFQPDAPFVGLRGRTRLAVIDGLVSEDVARLLAGTLGDDERVVICGTAIDPLAGRVVRELRAGSSVRKIPASILEEYRQARWSPVLIGQGAEDPDPTPAASGDGAAPAPSEVA